jgi:hypothetical protein
MLVEKHASARRGDGWLRLTNCSRRTAGGWLRQTINGLHASLASRFEALGHG